jgi:hypothetical protein
MKIRPEYYLLIFLLGFSLLACNDDSGLSVSPELQPYLDSFEEEARARGIDLDFDVNPVTANFNRIPNSGIAGQCFRNPDIPNSISIDLVFWNTQDEIGKEFLMYHELGHCAIGREHRDETDSFNTCLSIMHSVVGICNNTYGPATKDDLLDELFGF